MRCLQYMVILQEGIAIHETNHLNANEMKDAVTPVMAIPDGIIWPQIFQADQADAALILAAR